MSNRSHFTRPEEHTPSPSTAPHLTVPIPIVGTDEDTLEAPHFGSTPSTVASLQGIRSQVTDPRPFIEPRGDGFSDVPIHIRNLWFEEFSRRFRWCSEHTSLIKINWKKKCKKRLSDTLCKIRKSSTCPQWISPDNWSQMKQRFSSPAFERISGATKRNRSLAGPSHTGGSISFSEHENRERKLKGDEFTYKELYKRLHMFQSGPEKGEFITDQYRQVLDNVEQIQQRYSQSHVDSNSSISSHSIPNEKEIFVEVVGGFKRGRVFGLGSEGVVLRQDQTSPSLVIGEVQSKEYIEKKIEDKVQKVEQKWKTKFKRLERTYRKRDDAISSWMSMMSTMVGVAPPPPISTDLDAFDMEDDADAHDDSFTSPPGSRLDHLPHLLQLLPLVQLDYISFNRYYLKFICKY